MEVNENEAEIVRRIFEMSAAGMSLKSIAKKLNEEHVPSPRPRKNSKHATWAPTAIRQMLRRELYIGKVVWNRSKFVKVPGKNKRVARKNPKEQWRTVDHPELRIIDDQLWTKVQTNLVLKAEKYATANKGLTLRCASSPYLLSGFLKCGICGGNVVIVTGRKGRYAKYGCSQHWYRGACPNKLRISQADIEARIFAELEKVLLEPHVTSLVVSELEKQLKTTPPDSSSAQSIAVERKKIEGELERLTSAVAETGHSLALLKAISEREARLEALVRKSPRKSGSGTYTDETLRDFAVEKLRDLPKLLSADPGRAKTELMHHVSEITLTPVGSGEDAYYQCEGNWNLLGADECGVRMVAGGGFEPPTFGL